MFKPKNFKLAAAEIVRLLDRPMGAGLATDHITVEGYPVGYMYREEPDGPTDIDAAGRNRLAPTRTQLATAIGLVNMT